MTTEESSSAFQTNSGKKSFELINDDLVQRWNDVQNSKNESENAGRNLIKKQIVTEKNRIDQNTFSFQREKQNISTRENDTFCQIRDLVMISTRQNIFLRKKWILDKMRSFICRKTFFSA